MIQMVIQKPENHCNNCNNFPGLIRNSTRINFPNIWIKYMPFAFCGFKSLQLPVKILKFETVKKMFAAVIFQRNALNRLNF